MIINNSSSKLLYKEIELFFYHTTKKKRNMGYMLSTNNTRIDDLDNRIDELTAIIASQHARFAARFAAQDSIISTQDTKITLTENENRKLKAMIVAQDSTIATLRRNNSSYRK
jgi:16S rRNA U516 pseudouridylate synthase RsuA-like enzyme